MMSTEKTAMYLVDTLEKLQEINKRIDDGMKLQDPSCNSDGYAYMYKHGNKWHMIIESDEKRDPMQFLTDDEKKKLKTHKEMKEEGADV
jgi:hypothetical protein